MITLYELPYCPFCQKVKAKLEALNVEFETVVIDPNDRPEIVMKLGGTVPVITDGDIELSESADIIDYLEKTYGKSTKAKESSEETQDETKPE